MISSKQFFILLATIVSLLFTTQLSYADISFSEISKCQSRYLQELNDAKKQFSDLMDTCKEKLKSDLAVCDQLPPADQFACMQQALDSFQACLMHAITVRDAAIKQADINFQLCIQIKSDQDETKKIKLTKFKLEKIGDSFSTITGKWYSVSGDGNDIGLTENTVGKDQREQKRPGGVYFTDITLKGPFVGDKNSIKNLIKDFRETREDQNLNDKNRPININPTSNVVELDCHAIQVSDGEIEEESFEKSSEVDIGGDRPIENSVMKEFRWTNIAIASEKQERDILSQWLQDAPQGNNIRKNITIILEKNDGDEGRRYDLMDCFPIKFDPGDYSPSSTTSTEKIEIVIGRIEPA